MVFYSLRGVLQSLVEKHFPAPDRNRIHRVLGLDLPQTNAPINCVAGTLASGSIKNIKRKPRQAAQRASKRVCAWSSEDEMFDQEKHGDRSSGSEFKFSESETEEEGKSDDEISNPSSDYNPFDSDSDSDIGKYVFSRLYH